MESKRKDHHKYESPGCQHGEFWLDAKKEGSNKPNAPATSLTPMN